MNFSRFGYVTAIVPFNDPAPRNHNCTLQSSDRSSPIRESPRTSTQYFNKKAITPSAPNDRSHGRSRGYIYSSDR
ncbi:MAG: hypothetical protein WCA35_17365 [Kovacikia sp.]